MAASPLLTTEGGPRPSPERSGVDSYRTAVEVLIAGALMTSVPRRPYQRMDLRLATFVSRYGPRPARPDLPSPSVLLGTDAAALLSFSAIRSRGRKRTRTDRLTQVDNLAVSRANRSPPEGASYIRRRRAVAGAEHSPSQPRSPPPHAGGRSPGGAPAGGPALNATEPRPIASTAGRRDVGHSGRKQAPLGRPHLPDDAGNDRARPRSAFPRARARARAQAFREPPSKAATAAATPGLARQEMGTPPASKLRWRARTSRVPNAPGYYKRLGKGILARAP
jgi:hypothetical protein